MYLQRKSCYITNSKDSRSACPELTINLKYKLLMHLDKVVQPIIFASLQISSANVSISNKQNMDSQNWWLTYASRKREETDGHAKQRFRKTLIIVGDVKKKNYSCNSSSLKFLSSYCYSLASPVYHQPLYSGPPSQRESQQVLLQCL